MRYVFLLLSLVICHPLLCGAEVNVNVNLGVPPPPRPPMPPPPLRPPPPPRVVVSTPPAVIFQAEPLFLSPSQLGFYVGVDTPYDIIFDGGYYYLYYGDGWYRSGHYNGPWARAHRSSLPHGIRRHKLDFIRSHRDREYRVYYQDRDHYRGNHFRGEHPGHERREHIREERHHEREERHDNRGHDRGEGHRHDNR